MARQALRKTLPACKKKEVGIVSFYLSRNENGSATTGSDSECKYLSR